MENIAKGAEATISKDKNTILKNRTPKSYRLPKIDKKIRKRRTKSEAKIIDKASSLIPTPKIISSSPKDGKITMTHIKGVKLATGLDTLKSSNAVCSKIGENLAKLHNNQIIHGDLTTSNMIYNKEEDKLYFIDFGLSYISRKIEDQAVDLHLIKEALEAKHPKHFKQFFNKFLEGYKKTHNQPDKVLKRLEKVEKRGRYKRSNK